MDHVRQPEVVDHLANLTLHGAVTEKNEPGAWTMLPNLCECPNQHVNSVQRLPAASGDEDFVLIPTQIAAKRQRGWPRGETLEIDSPWKRDNPVVRNRRVPVNGFANSETVTEHRCRIVERIAS